MTTRELLKTVNLTANERLLAEARLARAEAMVEMAQRAGRAICAFAAGISVGSANFARRLRSLFERQPQG
jgi:hypothetical protein